jgi:hypothetical protein
MPGNEGGRLGILDVLWSLILFGLHPLGLAVVFLVAATAGYVIEARRSPGLGARLTSAVVLGLLWGIGFYVCAYGLMMGLWALSI